MTFVSGPNSTGRFEVSATPLPFGPRNRAQSLSFAVARVRALSKEAGETTAGAPNPAHTANTATIKTATGIVAGTRLGMGTPTWFRERLLKLYPRAMPPTNDGNRRAAPGQLAECQG
jgi:hypothetical protein